MRTPSGDVVPDASGRVPGRGAYVCRVDECLDKAIAKGALGRSLKIPLPADVRTALGEGRTTMNTIIEGGARGQE